jgi:hypothetical protein
MGYGNRDHYVREVTHTQRKVMVRYAAASRAIVGLGYIRVPADLRHFAE